MRIRVRLPKIESEVYTLPKTCPHGCGGAYFKPHGVQGEAKAVRDPQCTAVVSYRYECTRCHKTFRVYPQGVSAAQQSDRLKAMSVLLYVLGLSYGAAMDFLTACGCGVSRTTVYNNVQAAGGVARKRQHEQVTGGGKRKVIGADGTFVKIKGQTVGIEVVVDDATGELLGLDIITSENAGEIVELIRTVVNAVDPEVIVSDDHGAYNEVAEELDLAHQICRNHVKRNVDDLAVRMSQQLQHQQHPPEAVDSSAERLQQDLAAVKQLIRERPANGAEQLEALYHRYQGAPGPQKGKRHSVWYRMRMLVTRLWERWPRLTLDQRRDDLNGTNNMSERVIGWCIKERYRTMRGYKRTLSVKNVVTLTARMSVRSGNYDMAELFL